MKSHPLFIYSLFPNMLGFQCSFHCPQMRSESPAFPHMPPGSEVTPFSLHFYNSDVALSNSFSSRVLCLSRKGAAYRRSSQEAPIMTPQHSTKSRRSWHQSVPVLSHAGADSDQQSPTTSAFSSHCHATHIQKSTTRLAIEVTMLSHDHKINRTTAQPRSLFKPYWTIGCCDCWWV